MLIVGLTGGIGSGKTTVSNMFKDLGVEIIDTDVIARNLVNNPLVLEEITHEFGAEILTSNKALNRKKLSALVFNDKHKKQLLEKILHPKIRDEVNSRIKGLATQTTSPNYVIVVIPLLFETDFYDLIDRILVVISQEDKRIKRVIDRDDRSIDEIRAILDSQANDERRIDEADDILENNNDIKALEPKILLLHNKYNNLSLTYP